MADKRREIMRHEVMATQSMREIFEEGCRNAKKWGNNWHNKSMNTPWVQGRARLATGFQLQERGDALQRFPLYPRIDALARRCRFKFVDFRACRV